MNPDRTLEKAFRQIVEVCAAGPGLLALLVLFSWILGRPMLGAFGSNYLPMAPGTAGLMLILSCSLILHRRRPGNSAVYKFSLFSAGITLIISLLMLG